MKFCSQLLIIDQVFVECHTILESPVCPFYSYVQFREAQSGNYTPILFKCDLKLYIYDKINF